MIRRFAIRDILLATTLVAVGMAGVIGVNRTFGRVNQLPGTVIPAIAAALVGAAAGSPIKGKLIGAVAALLIYFFLVAYYPDLK